jgi:hypothetical protein
MNQEVNIFLKLQGTGIGFAQDRLAQFGVVLQPVNSQSNQ